MTLNRAIAGRILTLCAKRRMSVTTLIVLGGVGRTTLYGILRSKNKDPRIATLKKLCDGLEITLGEFFSTPEFDALEQEIR
ncbi:MAG: helix-turn-helix domain-containing protein [Oscillospiraceae bacterium]